MQVGKCPNVQLLSAERLQQLQVVIVAAVFLSIVCYSTFGELKRFHRPSFVRPTNASRWFLRKHREIGHRFLTLQRACAAEGDATRWSQPPDDFLADRERGVGYCRQAKTGTTTILRHFLNLAEASGNVSRHKVKKWSDQPGLLHRRIPELFGVASGMDMEQFRDHVDDLINFSFVRHPFERLVSAFLHKAYINERYKDLHASFGSNFSLFADFVIEDAKKNCLRADRCAMDRHWRPLYARCAYCDVPYHVIGKVETFSDDVRYIGVLKGLEGIWDDKHAPTIKMNSVEASNKSDLTAGSSADRTAVHFGQLSSEQKKQLYQTYRLDFELFGYNYEEYM